MVPKLRLALVLLLVIGSGAVQARSEKPATTAKDKDKKDKDKIETIGDVAAVFGLGPVLVEGVGLVVGLDNTGSDPPPSIYRELVLTDMQKREIKDPNRVLASPQTSVVLVRAYLPPAARENDPVDVEVRVPSGHQTTSLRGGWLWQVHLTETSTYRDPKTPNGPPQFFYGHPRAIAGGPVLVSPNLDGQAGPGLLTQGRILGGAKVTQDRPMALLLASGHKSVRTSQQVASRINLRFHAYGHNGLMQRMAEAKTDQQISLQVPVRYRYNVPRFLRVVRRLPLYDSPTARQLRVEQLASELDDPETSAEAALKLEGMSLNEAGPILKSALESPRPAVRFFAAEALAYMGEPACAKELTAAAGDNPAFRIYALTALSALDEAISHEALRNLMDAVSAETRYGAFRALWAMDERDPLVRGEKLNDQFFLHVIDSQGPPMVHLARSFRPEVTIFGREHKLQTPLSLQAGPQMLITASRDDHQVHLTRFSRGGAERKATASLTVADVIRKAAELGATYPDVVEMLAAGERQRALEGRLEIDAIPKPGRLDFRQADEPGPQDSEEKSEPVGAVPNLFAQFGDSPPPSRKSESKEPAKPDQAKSAETRRGIFGRLLGRQAN